jgi:hypothetical protein
MPNTQPSRRRFIRNSAFGLIGTSAFGNIAAFAANDPGTTDEGLFYRYPGINDALVSAVVGASHNDLNKVKDLVNKRPELAVVAWDWGFGDTETALGAASHVGRRDIAEFLMNKGARPDIFTFVMLGSYRAVQEMVETVPGIQSIPGPHGITLLQHAKNRLRSTDISETDKSNVNKVVSYLEGLGNADIKPKSLEITEEEKQKYFGEYRFGKKEDEIFTVNTNSRQLLQISRKGYSGRTMHKIDNTVFSPSGSPSVSISFTLKDDKAVSLTIHEPDPLVTGIRV